MGQEKGADQTEKPTPKRLQDARKDGEVYRSQDLSRTLSLLLWLILFWLAAESIWTHLQNLVAAIFLQAQHPTSQGLLAALHLAGISFLKSVLPLIFTAGIVGVLVEFLQVGAIFATKRLAPKLERVNPAEGLKRLFSQENLIEVLKGVIKTAALVAIALVVIRASLGGILKLSQGPIAAMLEAQWQTLIWLTSGVIFIFFFVSVLDVIYQRHAFTKNLLMSRRDIKQEHKDSEGDPMVKGQRRQLHQEWSQQNMLAAVRKASVVVTNPTHVAVALLYEKGETDLPLVVAKGEDHTAALIRQAAEEAGVPIMQNVDLARGLYAEIPLDTYITADFFEAVAEVLLWVETVKNE